MLDEHAAVVRPGEAVPAGVGGQGSGPSVADSCWVESEVDAALAALHPELVLTVAMIRAEVDGRVDLNRIDLVRATHETVMRAAAKGTSIGNPAEYVAVSIVRYPEKWQWTDRPVPFAPMADLAGTADTWGQSTSSCDRDGHDWGPEKWGERARGACVICGTDRRKVDPAWAELEAEFARVGGANA